MAASRWQNRVVGVVLLLMWFVMHGSTLNAQSDRNGAFASAIAFGQKRVVKVYGATAGRVDGYASGILVSPDGLVITMQGVYLDGKNTRVTLPDGRQVPAVVMRRNRELQLALLRIDESTPDYFELSDQPTGDQGDWVVTLSNAFKVADGIEPMSVNLGVISLRTSIRAQISPRDIAYEGPLILIDAITSNPGAGGGAVMTDEGKLVGTIGRVINSSETNTRLNYAVPVEILRKFLDNELESAPQLATADKQPGDLGVRVFRLGGRQSPAYIDRIIKGSTADAAELRPDDLIVSLGGEKIGTIREFDSVMENVFAGEEIIIVVKRGNQLIRVPLVPAAKDGQ
jgi:serine protease Do